MLWDWSVEGYVKSKIRLIRLSGALSGHSEFLSTRCLEYECDSSHLGRIGARVGALLQCRQAVINIKRTEYGIAYLPSPP